MLAAFPGNRIDAAARASVSPLLTCQPVLRQRMRRRRSAAELTLVVRRLQCFHQAPAMEEDDLVVGDRQAHSRGPASLCQRTDYGAERFGSSGIVDDPHPLFEFSAHIPGGVRELAK